jgi:hypothetical protein
MTYSSFLKTTVLAFLLPFLGISAAVAVESPSDSHLSRGQVADTVVNYFEIKANNQLFLENCQLDYETCLFTFSTRTNFDDFRLEPLILYPDVYPAYRYYDSINLLSLVDVVSGYYLENQSPFRPEQSITKVEALKLVMGASGIMTWKEKFEISLEENSWLKLDLGGDKWWYDRYLATAVEKGFLEGVSEIEAEQGISEAELLHIMEGANKIVADRQELSLIDIYGQLNQETDTSGNSGFEADCEGGSELCSDTNSVGTGQYS